GADRGVVEVGEDAAGRVLGEVPLVHLQHVRGVAAGDLGGELVPVPAPVAGLRGDRHLGRDLLVRLERGIGQLITLRVAPPGEAQRAARVATASPASALGGVRAAGGKTQQRQRGGSGTEDGAARRAEREGGHRSSFARGEVMARDAESSSAPQLRGYTDGETGLTDNERQRRPTLETSKPLSASRFAGRSPWRAASRPGILA